jgi:hypothetical protein
MKRLFLILVDQRIGLSNFIHRDLVAVERYLQVGEGVTNLE